MPSQGTPISSATHLPHTEASLGGELSASLLEKQVFRFKRLLDDAMKALAATNRQALEQLEAQYREHAAMLESYTRPDKLFGNDGISMTGAQRDQHNALKKAVARDSKTAHAQHAAVSAPVAAQSAGGTCQHDGWCRKGTRWAVLLARSVRGAER